MAKLTCDDITKALIRSARALPATRQVHAGFHSNASREFDSLWLSGEFDWEKLQTELNAVAERQ